MGDVIAIVESREGCCVVDQFCQSPANAPQVTARFECFKCGLRVCARCSMRVSYKKFGRVRMCHDCICEMDGNDNRAVAHLRRLAR